MRKGRKTEDRKKSIHDSFSTPRKHCLVVQLWAEQAKTASNPQYLLICSPVGKYSECTQETVVLPPTSKQPLNFTRAVRNNY